MADKDPEYPWVHGLQDVDSDATYSEGDKSDSEDDSVDESSDEETNAKSANWRATKIAWRAFKGSTATLSLTYHCDECGTR